MSIRAQKTASTPWSALFFALLGLVWCGYVAFPSANSAPCLSSGCELFRDSRFAGISLWWVGGAYFFLLTVVCLRNHYLLARFMASVALFLDALLLLAMFFTAPCFDCLIVALFFGLTFYSLRSAGEGWFVNSQTPSLMLPIWFGLFLGNAVLVANEHLPQYAIGGSRSDVRIYFSPSCEACRAALLTADGAAMLYPVEEREGDLDAIIRLAALLQANVPVREAVSRSLDPNEALPPLPFYRRILLSVQVLRNKAAMMRQGFRVLPVIQMSGMPSSTVDALRSSGAPAPGRTSRGNAAPRRDEGASPYAPPETAVNSPLPEEGRMTPRSGASDTEASPSGPLPADADHLPDFLLQNAQDLTGCSRDSGQPCD